MKGISKAYPGVQALDHVSLEVRSGECHALVGENGAGKSTLMKILAGAIQPDEGEIFVGGARVAIASPLEGRKHGISMIHQELSLLPRLTVAENIFLGREPRRVTGLLNRRKMINESREWLGRMHQQIDPKCVLGRLSLAEQQMVEIVKALSMEAHVMIMDEPSAILTDTELEELFRLVLRLKSEGLALIHISHRLEEIFRICDRVTVMRDGRTIATHDVKQISQPELIREMVGRELSQIFPAARGPGSDVVLEVKNLTRAPRLRDVSLRVRRGEIVGLSGLVGAGRSELARTIFGADPIDEGEILFEGKPLRGHNPREAIRRGLGFLTEDRKAQGLLPDMTLCENVSVANLARIARGGVIRKSLELKAIRPLAESLRIRTPSLNQRVGALSGGNQQKTVLARWLFTESRFLIFDEPTRGIDVGAKSEIYQLIADLLASGRSILVISSDLQEILGLCRRIYAMREGTIVAEFADGSATQERLLAAAMGITIPD